MFCGSQAAWDFLTMAHTPHPQILAQLHQQLQSVKTVITQQLATAVKL